MDNWIGEYESTLNLGNTILADISERNKRALLNEDVTMFQNQISRKIKQYQDKCEALEDTLQIQSADPITYGITPQEIQRRTSSLANLRNQVEIYNLKIKQNPKEAAREQLGLNNQRRAWGESDETKQLDNRGIYQLNQQKIDDQEKDLKQLSKTVGRITNVAEAIGEEIDESTKLIKKMDPKLDRVNTKVAVETRRVDILRQEAATGGCWIFIIILFIVIIVLAIV